MEKKIYKTPVIEVRDFVYTTMLCMSGDTTEKYTVDEDDVFEVLGE